MISFFLASLVSSSLLVQPHDERAFLLWMRQHGQMFTGPEYHLRLGIFLTKARYIQDFNRGNHLYRLGLNAFSCFTPAEVSAFLGPSFDASPRSPAASVPHRGDVPDALDYRDRGVVTPVKDQGDCGSCWAFSAILTSESNYALKTGTLIELSEQNLVDCVPGMGCQGGHAAEAMDYVIQSQGGKFMTRADYPYVRERRSCVFDPAKAVASLSSYVKVNWGDEEDLKQKIANYGVASVSIDAAGGGILDYSGGIIDPPFCTVSLLNHALGCVGYGAEGGTGYWILKNTWGTQWGEGGYMRLIRKGVNRCGVASLASVAIP